PQETGPPRSLPVSFDRLDAVMAISFSCPSCDHTIKVKDELAGRKVRCPECSTAIRVPELEVAEEEEPSPRKRLPAREDGEQPLRKQSRPAADEDEEAPPPRKKKKKKSIWNKEVGFDQSVHD